MECRQCGGKQFRKGDRADFLQDAVSKLGFFAWECQNCHKVCFVRTHGLAMVAEPGTDTGVRSVGPSLAPAVPFGASPLLGTSFSPAAGYSAPRRVRIP